MSRTCVNFAKDYQTYSYNKSNLMGKKLREQTCIKHIKKTLVPSDMWNCKTLKIQRAFQN